MKLKSYQTNSVEAAIRLAKVELGDEAIFMGSRENGPGDGSEARYEVTFAAVTGDVLGPGNDGRAARGNSESSLSRPAWVGLARRGLGSPKIAPPRGPRPNLQSTPAGGSKSGPALRHWRNFLPPESRVKPCTGQMPPESAPPPSGSLERAEPPLSPTTPGHEGAAGTAFAQVPGEKPNNRLHAAIERLSHEANRLRGFLLVPPTREMRTPAVPANETLDPACSNGIEVLISQGMCAAAARKLIGEALSNCPRPISPKSLQFQLEVSIAQGCRVDATLGRTASPSEPAVVAFVGPAGAGKTSAMCKLAVRFGLQADRPVHLVSLDDHRLGGSEQLGSFADLLSSPFTEVDDGRETVAAVRRALAGTSTSRPPLILIDTPGYGPADWKRARSLAHDFAGMPGLDTHVVVAATSSEGHLRRTLDAFRIFQPRKLLITKLDECAEAGAIVGETLRCRLPVSYFSTGQQIPEDIAAASPGRLAQQLLQAF